MNNSHFLGNGGNATYQHLTPDYLHESNILDLLPAAFLRVQ